MSSDFANQLADALIWAMCFIFSSTVHEAAHAWAALKGGDDTAYQGGQVTLNPIPHIKREPVGMVVIPLVSFLMTGFMIGWASAPYNPYWAERYPKRAAAMALAGPMGNLLIALVAAFLFRALILLNVLEPTSQFHLTATSILHIMVILNLVLCVFNLIPVAPLDGGTAVVLLFPEEMARKVLGWTHMFGIMGIFIAWLLMNKIMGSGVFNSLVTWLLVPR